MNLAFFDVFFTESTHPWLNLALENVLFERLSFSSPTLLVTRNRESVVIGRSQNPWLECHLEAMKKDGVFLARRTSGGGAVYHDIGNVNITLFTTQKMYNKKTLIDLLINALKRVGVSVISNEYHDLCFEVEGQRYKVSGSAFRQTKNKCFHHMTLLIQANLEKLHCYLKPSTTHIIGAKGAKSRRSKVTTLAKWQPDLRYEAFVDVLIAQFSELLQRPIQSKTWQESELRDDLGIQTLYHKLSDWEWLFAKTMPFKQRIDTQFSWGSVSMMIAFKNGLISVLELTCLQLGREISQALSSALTNIPYQQIFIEAVFYRMKIIFPDFSKKLTDIQQQLLAFHWNFK